MRMMLNTKFVLLFRNSSVSIRSNLIVLKYQILACSFWRRNYTFGEQMRIFRRGFYVGNYITMHCQSHCVSIYAVKIIVRNIIPENISGYFLTSLYPSLQQSCLLHQTCFATLYWIIFNITLKHHISNVCIPSCHGYQCTYNRCIGDIKSNANIVTRKLQNYALPSTQLTSVSSEHPD